ncbi:hypothetical protein BIV23_39490 [Streptomyces monashensis]|uniref:Uncharacterized protein n=1 Tax=Streptomyces monashensis TaxID=1678012 RepID=A0A1S2PER1_9ACTN|nr:hypothetical protein BIV23_39490 [Streptomyces monashensis]
MRASPRRGSKPPDQVEPVHHFSGRNRRPRRRIPVDSKTQGTAYSLHELSVFLERTGLEGLDVVDLVKSRLIEWRGDGPAAWEH